MKEHGNAVKDGCDVFVFHDVDLIPSVELTTWCSEQRGSRAGAERRMQLRIDGGAGAGAERQMQLRGNKKLG